jgi:hypothetical protein
MQEVTGVIFKAGAQKNLFEHPIFFNKESPLLLADVDTIQVKTKTIDRSNILLDCIEESIDAEEEESSMIMRQLSDTKVMAAYDILIRLRKVNNWVRINFDLMQPIASSIGKDIRS